MKYVTKEMHWCCETCYDDFDNLEKAIKHEEWHLKKDMEIDECDHDYHYWLMIDYVSRNCKKCEMDSQHSKIPEAFMNLEDLFHKGTIEGR